MRLNPELSELESAKHIRQLLGLKVLELNVEQFYRQVSATSIP